MHSRNRYADKKLDFGELAEFRPSLKPFLLQKNDPSTQPHSFSLDFSKPAALRELACALLERDFGITLEIPLDKLIPTVPLRLNYIHWLEDLLSGDANPSIPKGTSIVGIDIGMMMFCSQPHPDHTQTTPRPHPDGSKGVFLNFGGKVWGSSICLVSYPEPPSVWE